MITVRLLGGLGNQLFQYAVGRSLSIDRDDSLYLDASFYDYPHFWTATRECKLNHFNITGDFIHCPRLPASFMSLVSQGAWKMPEMVNFASESLFRKIPCPIHQTQYIHESILNSCPEMFDLSGNLYLDGNWQSEKYFDKYPDVIKNDLRVLTSPSPENIKWGEFISKQNTICLHVRRGDYVTDSVAKQHVGTCSLDYYKRAIDYIADRVDNPVFIVFSDDIPWAREHIPICFPVYYMTHNNGETDYEDLRLMSLCKNFITANSSFSWWGAWLGDYEDKIVVCPQRWYNDGTKNNIIPDRWVKI